MIRTLLWEHLIIGLCGIFLPIQILEEGQRIGIEGKNHFGDLGYGGPCPPKGTPHRYFFKLYALDRILDLPEGSSKYDLECLMHDHILDLAELIGIYTR